jgi:hypothetical protein
MTSIRLGALAYANPFQSLRNGSVKGGLRLALRDAKTLNFLRASFSTPKRTTVEA